MVGVNNVSQFQVGTGKKKVPVRRVHEDGVAGDLPERDGRTTPPFEVIHLLRGDPRAGIPPPDVGNGFSGAGTDAGWPCEWGLGCRRASGGMVLRGRANSSLGRLGVDASNEIDLDRVPIVIIS